MFSLLISVVVPSFAQPPMPSMEKNTKAIEATRDLPFSADEVWGVIAEDYGRIAESHPKIVRSEYRHGSLAGELGAERTCYFNDKGSMILHEQIVGWDPDQRTFQNRVVEAAGFPMDPDNTLAVYRVEPIGADRSRVTIEMDFRTKPAMMGAMMKGAFSRLLDDYLLSVEHHLATGESVTRDNFKTVAKLYK